MPRQSLYLFSFLLCFFPVLILSAQRGITAEDLDFAEKYASEYEDYDIASPHHLIQISFEFDKDRNTVIAREISKEELMSLKKGAVTSVAKTYDSRSEIVEAEGRLRGGKKIPYGDVTEPQHQPMEIGGVFYSDAKICWFNMRFPDQGRVYEANFEKQINDIRFLPSKYFHQPYPAAEVRFEVIVPDWLDLEIKEMNFEAWGISSGKERSEKSGLTTYHYTLKDCAPRSSDEFAPGPSHIYPHLLLVPREFDHPDGQGKFFSSFKDLYAWYNSLVSEVNNDPAATGKITGSLVNPDDSDEEKIRKIFYWVQDNIRYIAFEDGIAGFKPDNAQNVAEKGYGDCKGMANLCKVLLKKEGIDARLCWLGTRRIAYDYSIPSLMVDNHMICAVMKDGEPTFLDPTEKHAALGEYAERIQNRQVLIENGAEPLLFRIPKRNYPLNRESVEQELKLEGSDLVGATVQTFQEESKTRFLQNISSFGEDDLSDLLPVYLSRGDGRHQVGELDLSNLDLHGKQLSLPFESRLQNVAQSFGEEIYLEFDFFKDLNDLDLEDRETALFFPYKAQKMLEVSIEIPEGYEIKYFPEEINVVHSEFVIKTRFSREADKLNYTREISLPNAIISKENLGEFESALRQLKSTYQDNIILAK